MAETEEKPRKVHCLDRLKYKITHILHRKRDKSPKEASTSTGSSTGEAATATAVSSSDNKGTESAPLSPPAEEAPVTTETTPVEGVDAADTGVGEVAPALADPENKSKIIELGESERPLSLFIRKGIEEEEEGECDEPDFESDVAEASPLKSEPDDIQPVGGKEEAQDTLAESQPLSAPQVNVVGAEVPVAPIDDITQAEAILPTEPAAALPVIEHIPTPSPEQSLEAPESHIAPIITGVNDVTEEGLAAATQEAMPNLSSKEESQIETLEQVLEEGPPTVPAHSEKAPEEIGTAEQFTDALDQTEGFPSQDNLDKDDKKFMAENEAHHMEPTTGGAPNTSPVADEPTTAQHEDLDKEQVPEEAATATLPTDTNGKEEAEPEPQVEHEPDEPAHKVEDAEDEQEPSPGLGAGEHKLSPALGAEGEDKSTLVLEAAEQAADEQLAPIQAETAAVETIESPANEGVATAELNPTEEEPIEEHPSLESQDNHDEEEQKAHKEKRHRTFLENIFKKKQKKDRPTTEVAPPSPLKPQPQ